MSDEDRRRWNERYARGSHSSEDPSPFLVSLASQLPSEGRALDIAGGAGRNALFLASLGLDVTLVDISDVGLAHARDRAHGRGLPLRTEQRDLERDGLPAGPWDLLLSVLFLDRSLLPRYPEVLAPGGLLVVAQPTKLNLERHPKPPKRFLLDPGELLEHLGTSLEVISFHEGWTEDGRHEARLLARKKI